MKSIIESDEIVLSNGNVGHAIKFELGVLMVVDTGDAKGDENNFVSDGVELLICSQRIPNFPISNLPSFLENSSKGPKTRNSLNFQKRWKPKTTPSHASNAGSKATSGRIVLSTLRKQLAENERKEGWKLKKAYIAWEDNASKSSDSSSEKEIAYVCLMDNSMDDSSTIEETEVNFEFEEVLEAFHEIHEEAQKLVVSNNKLRGNLKWLLDKLASTQSKLDKLKKENEKLVSSYKASNCVCSSTSFNMDDYKSLQNDLEKFKKDHYKQCMKLQTKLSYLKDLFRKMNKEKSDVGHLLSVCHNLPGG
ncbi:hypothetical protein HKD37_13G035438 [Glycine soja]